MPAFALQAIEPSFFGDASCWNTCDSTNHRAVEAAHASAQVAIQEAENRATVARDEHERFTRELDEQMAKAKVNWVDLYTELQDRAQLLIERLL